MKTRNDFVSNSSSCSFVVAINSSYPLKTFIDDLVLDTLEKADEDDSNSFVEKVRESNKRNLEYHLNCSELLFLGTLRTKDRVEVYENKDDSSGWNDYKEMSKVVNDSYYSSHPEEKNFVVEEKTDDMMRICHKEYAEEITVLSECMEYAVGRYGFAKTYTEEDRKRIAKNIFDYASKMSDVGDSFTYHLSSRIYKITQNTIDNTRDLIAAGYEVVFDDWQDLDALEDRIKKGQKLFGIRLANGGDGMSDTTIYGLGGWDAQIGEHAQFETIYSECC